MKRHLCQDLNDRQLQIGIPTCAWFPSHPFMLKTHKLHQFSIYYHNVFVFHFFPIYSSANYIIDRIRDAFLGHFLWMRNGEFFVAKPIRVPSPIGVIVGYWVYRMFMDFPIWDDVERPPKVPKGLRIGTCSTEFTTLNLQ